MKRIIFIKPDEIVKSSTILCMFHPLEAGQPLHPPPSRGVGLVEAVQGPQLTA